MSNLNSFDASFPGMRALIICLAFAQLLPIAVYGQVNVTVRTNKTTYFVGEPIWVIVNVKNVGTDPVAYGGGSSSENKSSVNNAERVSLPPGCVEGGWAGGFGDGPQLKPGESTEFFYLVKGYRLKAGGYDISSQGTAPVFWHLVGDYRRSRGPTPTPAHPNGAPVEGSDYLALLQISVLLGSETELEAAYAPLLADLDKTQSSGRKLRAMEGVAEMAPPFLESTIIGFGSNRDTVQFAIKGLQRISSPTAREALTDLLDRYPEFRASVVAGCGL